jgi:hypothetical protein
MLEDCRLYLARIRCREHDQLGLRRASGDVRLKLAMGQQPNPVERYFECGPRRVVGQAVCPILCREDVDPLRAELDSG